MTDDDLLELALRGTGDDWERVHEVCEDRNRAEALARMLEQQTTAENSAAAAWANVLGELHPGLHVQLRSRPPIQ